jgi:hypothetical protein
MKSKAITALLLGGSCLLGAACTAESTGEIDDLPPHPHRILCTGANPGREYAIGTWRGTYLTAVGGGGRATEPVVRTDAQTAGPWEKFRLFRAPWAAPVWFIQTASGNCITAVDGGGRTTDVLHTDARVVQDWEWFLFSLDWHGYDIIATSKGYYLTALGGGGHADPPAVHTDATEVNDWERFRVWKCGDLGSNALYSIWVPYNGTLLQAMQGGGRILDALHAFELPHEGWEIFKLLRQEDGSYAIQTRKGNYITAVGGGGLSAGTPTSDNLHTDATQILAWEKFRFIDWGDCTYSIQTVNGWYLGFPPSTIFPGPRAQFTTRISDINAALKFKLIAYTFP